MNQDWNSTHTESETIKRKMEEGAQELDNEATLDEVKVVGSWKRKKVRGDEAQTKKLVSDKVSYRIFGENYANRFETKYGARVSFPPKGPRNDILLINIDDQVDNIDNLPYELIYSIDGRFIIVITNCCEKFIQRLRVNHNVNIKFGTEEVYISGRKRGCDDALSAILSMIKPLVNDAAVFRDEYITSSRPVFIPFEKQEPIQVKEKVAVPLDMIGLVAGKQFANANRLQEAYGVKVTIPHKGTGNNVIILEGLVDQVAAAKVDILENFYILEQEIDARFIGLIIGHKGEGLKRLSENYDIGIKFEDNKTVIINGKKERCETALREINSIVEKQLEIVAANIKKAPVYLPPVFIPLERQQPEYVKEKVIVPMDMVGLVAGKKFANVIRLQKTYGVKVTVPSKDLGSNEIILEGLVNQVAAAKVDILENLYVLKQDIDTRFVGLIIGKKGEGLNRLFRDHNLLGIKFVENRTVFITGRKDRCEAALSEINSIVEKSKQQADVIAVHRTVPSMVPNSNSKQNYLLFNAF